MKFIPEKKYYYIKLFEEEQYILYTFNIKAKKQIIATNLRIFFFEEKKLFLTINYEELEKVKLDDEDLIKNFSPQAKKNLDKLIIKLKNKEPFKLHLLNSEGLYSVFHILNMIIQIKDF